MKYLICTLVTIGVLYSSEADVAENRQRLLSTGLQLLEIETVDGEEPTCETIHAPRNCIGAGSINATKVPGRLTIQDQTGILYDSGDYKEKKSGLTIKIRGNTSSGAAKKSFKLKLQKKADLLLRGDDDLKVKEWVLLPHGELLNTAIGFEVNRLMNLPWTPNYRYVNLMVNGDIRGVYVLVDAVERNPPGRLDVDENEGFIIECDAYWWNEDVYFKTSMCHRWTGYTFKYPDPDDVSYEQIAAISNVMEAVERSVATGCYQDHLDVDSFVSWLLAHDLLAEKDGAGSNIYLTKYDLSPDSLVKMGNMWDFDCIMKMTDAWSTINELQGYFIFSSLLKSPNSLYRVAYRAKWEQCRDSLKAGLNAFFNTWLDPVTCASYDAARKIDAERWGVTYKSTVDDIASIAAWFDNRFVWIDEHIDEIYNGTPNMAAWNSYGTTQIVFTVTNVAPVAWTEQTNCLALSYTDAFVGEKAINYTGYLMDAGGLATGTINLKSAKARSVRGVVQSKVTGTLQRIGQRRESLTGTINVSTGSATLVSKKGTTLNLIFGANEVTGYCDADTVKAVRNITGSAVAKLLVGNYVAALPEIAADGSTNGWLTLTATLNSRGRISSKLFTEEGKTFSSTSSLLIGESWSDALITAVRSSRLIHVYRMRFANDGTSVRIEGDARWQAEKFQYSMLLGKVLLPDGSIAEKARLKINKKTGLITGSMNVPTTLTNAKRDVSFTFKGVLINGLGVGMATRSRYTGIPIQIQ